MKQRTDQRNSEARTKAFTSRAVKAFSCTNSAGLPAGCRYWAIQNKVFRSRSPPFPSLTFGSTM